MTIHIVRIVLLMLGSKYTPTGGGAGACESKLITECGAGNSRLFSMKQAGKGQASPVSPCFGDCGNATNARTSTTMRARMKTTQRGDTRRPFGAGADAAGFSGASATASVASCSLDNPSST